MKEINKKRKNEKKKDFDIEIKTKSPFKKMERKKKNF